MEVPYPDDTGYVSVRTGGQGYVAQKDDGAVRWFGASGQLLRPRKFNLNSEDLAETGWLFACGNSVSNHNEPSADDPQCGQGLGFPYAALDSFLASLPSMPPSMPPPAMPPSTPTPSMPPSTPSPSAPPHSTLPSMPLTAEGAGDPHIVGAHGDKFDFKGEDRVVYAMFSASGFAVNARFVHDLYLLDKKEVHGSFMTEAYVVVQPLGQATVHICYNASDPDKVLLVAGRRQFALAISPFSTNEPGIDKFGLEGLRVELLKTHMNEAALIVSNGFWQVTCRTHFYPYSTNNHQKKRLDFSFSQIDEKAAAKVAPHGLVGQTFDGDKTAVDGAQDDYSGKVVVTKAMGEGAIEGTASDYAVKTPYSVDFVYSRFAAESAVPRNVSKLGGMKKSAIANAGVATTTNDNPNDAEQLNVNFYL